MSLALNKYLDVVDDDKARDTVLEADLSDEDASEVFAALAKEEEGHTIKYRVLSWQKVALLLFGEYVCLAMLALSWSFSVLGWGVALAVHFGAGLIAWYTSYVLWKFCMKHPHIRDVCDVAAQLFPFAPRLAREMASIMFLLNVILGVGFHVLTGAKIFNTLSNSSQCTVVFQAITAIIGIVISLPRTLNHVSYMSIVSVFFMAASVLVTLVCCGIQAHPGAGYVGVYPAAGDVKTFGGWPFGVNPGFINGFNAVLNIVFLWVGQIVYPSFIAEMKRPADFPKALAALTAMEFSLFTAIAVVGYYYLGQYAEAPLMGSLLDIKWLKVAYGFAIVPTFVIGTIYCNVACKTLFHRLLPADSRHNHEHTVVGWSLWVGLLTLIWGLGFVLAATIPSMGDFLSAMAAMFDSFFGYIYWAVAYWWLYRGKLFSSVPRALQTVLNLAIFAFGLFMLGPGLYTSISAIVADYSGDVARPFSCTTNSIIA